MKAAYRIQSVCECQALLTAELNDERQVVAASATRFGNKEVAPANAIGADAERFDVVWKCPMCGRNTLRVLYAGALQRLPEPPPVPAADAAEAEGGGELEQAS